MRFDVVSFGGAVVDTIIETDLKENKGNINIPLGTKSLITDINFSIGGGGTNTAAAFSNFGLKTGYIGKIGKDDFGERVKKLLKKNKIEFLGKENKTNKTGFSIIFLNKKNRSILTYKGINNEIKAGDIKNFETKWLYLSSLMGRSLKTQIELARKLKNKGTKIAFNPSEYLIKYENIKPLLKLCDVLILNKEESEELVGKKDVFKKINELGPKIIVITNNNKKISCFHDKKIYHLTPPKVKVVDPTGAGDAFASGFVAGLIVKKTIEESLILGLKESISEIKYLGVKNKLLKMKLK